MKCSGQIFFILTLIISSLATAQRPDVMTELERQVDLAQFQEMFTETIKVIGRSKKIFIITNNNQNLGKGDFITIVLNQDLPVARALVAKNHDGMTGIKVLKLYSLNGWRQLSQNKDIQIVRGDDSWLFKPKEAVAEVTEGKDIESEEDLYKIDEAAILNEGIGFDDDSKRHIKPDNLLGGGYSSFTLVDTVNNRNVPGNQWFGQWAYQIDDNIWLETMYGRTLISGYPNPRDNGQQILVNNLSFRAKYTLKAPFYTFIMPYIGFQIIDTSCPSCTQSTASNAAQNAINQNIESIEKQTFVVGATILTRLVPGWFARLDLGSDIIGAGFAIEF
jgi:hypothetical protein